MSKFFCVFLACFISPIVSSQHAIAYGDLDDMFEMSLCDLMDVEIVTSNKFKESARNVPASVVVLTRQEIALRGYQSLTDVLNGINGMYAIDDYYWLGSTNFGVRGFFSTGQFNDMIILVNGVNQMSDKYNDYPDVKINVPVQAIERIEVIRGPMSVNYGSGAFFGVINIITTEPTESSNAGAFAEASFDTQSGRSVFFRQSGAVERLKYSFDIGLSSLPGADVPLLDITSDTSVLEYVGLHPDATTGGQNDNSRLYAHLALEHEGWYTDISFAQSVKDVFDGQPSYEGGSEMRTHAATVALGIRENLSDDVALRLQGGFYHHSHVIDYELFRPNYYEIDAQNTQSFDLEANIDARITDDLRVVGGLYRRTVLNILQTSDFAYYGLDFGHGESTLPDDDVIGTSAVFAQAFFKPLDNITLVGGMRLEHLQSYTMITARGVVSEDSADNRDPDVAGNRTVFIGEFEPENSGVTVSANAAVLFDISEHHAVKLLYGEAIKQPSFTENYRQLSTGAPQLKPAEIQTFEVNYSAMFGESAFFSIGVFHNTLDALLSITNTYDQNTGEWSFYSWNSGAKSTTGVEVDARLHVVDNVLFDVAATYQNSQNDKEGYEDIALAYSPELLASWSLSWLPIHELSATISGKYTGEMETLWHTETTPEEGSRIGQKQDVFTVINASVGLHEILIEHLHVALSWHNVLDQEIRYPTTLSNVWADKGTVGRESRISLSCRWRF